MFPEDVLFLAGGKFVQLTSKAKDRSWKLVMSCRNMETPMEHKYGPSGCPVPCKWQLNHPAASVLKIDPAQLSSRQKEWLGLTMQTSKQQ